MGKLEGKVALVTGSGRNIGRATVLRLAGEGAHVVVNARSNQQEAETVAREARDLGVKAVPILADVGKKAEVEALAARALSEFGRVDILINNAAIRPHKPFTETTDADWELIRSVVLDGPLYLTRALIEPMIRDRYGRILFFEPSPTTSALTSFRRAASITRRDSYGERIPRRARVPCRSAPSSPQTSAATAASGNRFPERADQGKAPYKSVARLMSNCILASWASSRVALPSATWARASSSRSLVSR